MLGSLAVTDEAGAPLDVGGPKQRELLALLLLHVNSFLPPGRIADALWNGAPPDGGVATLRSHVSHLRRRLAAAGADGALQTKPAGYGLVLEPDQVDAARFERLLGLGQEAVGLGDLEHGAALLRDALAEWRGPVLANLDGPEFTAAEIARLNELRLVALESRIEADLALGRHTEVVAELEQQVRENPFRERFVAQLVLALYRSGRQVDALTAYAVARDRLADELGLDVAPDLASLEAAILRHDPAIAAKAAPLGVRGTTEPLPDALFAAARQLPVVGRDPELARLTGLWRTVTAGGRQVVLVSGEAGIGKTRLVAELAHDASPDRPAVLIGRCDPLGTGPYHPVAEALHTSTHSEQVVKAAAPEVRARLAPLLDGTAGDGERDTLYAAVAWLIGQIAANAPTLVVIEDADRIDRASALLLRHLVRRLPPRVLLAICFRDPPGTRHEPLLALIEAGAVHRIALGPLDRPALARMVARMTGSAPTTDQVDRLLMSTGGNPLFATEIVRQFGADGPSAGELPAGVRDMVRHRLRLLPDAARTLVHGAAVVGREAEFGLLAHLAELGEDDAVAATEQAVAAGFLVEAGRAWAGSYLFPHELAREAVYVELPVPARQRLHLRAARWALAERSRDVAFAAVHMRAAGPAADPRETAEVSLDAAQAAASAYAWDEAVVHAEAAVAILDRVDVPVEVLADTEVRTAMLRLKSSLGFDIAVRRLEDALAHYQAAGDTAATARVHSRLGGALCTHHSVMDIPRALEHFAAAERLLAGSPADFHVYRGKTQAAMFGLRTEELGAAGRQASALAEAAGRRDLSVLSGWSLAWYRFNRGELAAADATFEDIWAAVTDSGDPYLVWPVANAASLCLTDYLLDPAAARSWCRRALAQSRFDTFSHPHATVVDQLVLALATMGELSAARHAAERLPADAVGRRLLTFLDGGWEVAERSWAAALKKDEAAGDRHDAAVNARWLATARLALGNHEGAIAAWEQALTIGVDGPQIATELLARAALARILATEDAAGAHLARCDEILAGGEDWRGAAGVVEVARAAVAAAAGDHDGADDAFARALEILIRRSLPWRRADTLSAWAAALDARGDAGEAGTRRSEAEEVYRRIGAVARWQG